MSPFERILNYIVGFQFGGLVKLVVDFAFFLYIFFAFIIIRQVNLMSRTLVVPIAFPIKLLAWIHFGLAIFSFLVALVVL